MVCSKLWEDFAKGDYLRAEKTKKSEMASNKNPSEFGFNAPCIFSKCPFEIFNLHIACTQGGYN